MREIGSIHLNNGAVRFDRGCDCRLPARAEIAPAERPDIFLESILFDSVANGDRTVGLGFIPDPLSTDLDTDRVWQVLKAMPRIFVVFVRRSLLPWYISRVLAIQQRMRHMLAESAVPSHGVRLDPVECAGLFRAVRDFEERLLVGFADHSVIRIDYERWAQDPQSTLRSVFDFLGITPHTKETDIGLPVDQSPAQTIVNHSELVSAFAGTEWCPLFESLDALP